MDDRLKNILKLVIEDAIETGEPVGSQYLVDTYKLGVSPATIRNWFAELETDGYLTHPHTSSGRMPTEKGYRLYLTELMTPTPLSKRDVSRLEEAVVGVNEPERRAKILAKVIAEMIGTAVVLGLNRADTYYTGLSQLFAQPEFRDWNRVVNLGGVLDGLDDVLTRVRVRSFEMPTTFIGAECPFGPMCGSVFLNFDENILAAVLGPMRMNYRFAHALLLSAEEILNHE